jgi:hypothetical protein
MTALFDGLFDDASLFPPGNAPMSAAVPAHRDLRSRLGGLVGPFVVPATRLDELVAKLGDDEESLDVSVIAGADDLPEAVAHCSADPRLRLTAVEVPVVNTLADAVRVLRLLAELLPRAIPAAIEIPRTEAASEILDALTDTGRRAKVRTGGVRPDLFPDEGELAGTLIGCTSRGVSFKCTAGLHHAVRHTDQTTGFEHHGFLNVLVATDAAASGKPPWQIEALLAERDGATLAGKLDAWSAAQCAHVRSLFTSFGTCSVLEPVQDLVALELLAAPERTPA